MHSLSLRLWVCIFMKLIMLLLSDSFGCFRFGYNSPLICKLGYRSVEFCIYTKSDIYGIFILS